MKQPLVSIIIPTYNRAHLIGETLDSILAQTYTNWECIVVDDGSTDKTDGLLANYCEKDRRFQYHHRPSDRSKGANACRNYGFELSKGEYVNWFDSDDLMLEDFLKIKVNKIKKTKSDFVFSKTINFDSSRMESQIFDIDNKDKIISPFNFIKQSIAWCTLDFMAKRNTLENIKFNELLNSGQEYNFFSRYLYKSTKGIYIDFVLAKRRLHTKSIQFKVTNDKLQKEALYWKSIIVNRLLLLEDIKKTNGTNEKEWLINSIILYSFNIVTKKNKIPYFFRVLKNIILYKGVLKFCYFGLAILTGYLTEKGYKLMLKSKK